MPEADNNPFDTLADRIRDEAAQSSRSGQMERLEGIAREVERLRQGAKTLGHIIESNGRAILDITGRHDLIGEDGDGDWGAVWEHLYELPAKAWEQGFKTGKSSYSNGQTPNPYRAEVSR
jgi:hypothetical protein